MKMYLNFAEALKRSRQALLETGVKVHSRFWQGMDVSAKPEAMMYEVLNWSFSVVATDYDLPKLREHLKPNLPWADLHFEQERVGYQPLNPGETWKIWPWGNSADKHRTAGEQFNHTYAERFWPKYAGQTPGGKLKEIPPEIPPSHEGEAGPIRYYQPRRGIRYEYADLNDVIRMLLEDPYTRQAYIPIWFPEDGSHTDRKPCTLGYHVIRRGENIHMVYYIRSCDIVRHFQDDVYLAVRLLMWILFELQARDPANWSKVKLGLFTMHITSLHCFVNDRRLLENAR